MFFVDASYVHRPMKRSSTRRENLVDVVDDLKQLSLDLDRPLLHTVQFNRQAVRSARRNAGATHGEDTARGHLGLDKIAETDAVGANASVVRSEEHTSELQSRQYLVCRLLLEKKKKTKQTKTTQQTQKI